MAEQTNSADVPFDLCIIGAGIAGLNALFVATQYLPRSARVALIDRQSGCGGMWISTYPYVRLHQPHQMFTVGDFKWQWNKPREYLATRDEVLAHFQYCIAQLRQRVQLTELYEHSVESVQEVPSERSQQVHLRCVKLDGHGKTTELIAKRVIEAPGFEVPVPDALNTSSQQVRSTVPQRLLVEDEHAPVYVVGGGKTGMDTVLNLVRQYPSRRVTLVDGRGSLFVSRDLLCPSGTKRWRQGHLVSQMFADLAMRYDGSNTEECFEYFRQNLSVNPQSHGQQCLFGLMSEQEHREIEAGLSDSVSDYFADVVDINGKPEILFRSGNRLPVDVGSVIVNCSGHIYREPKPELPYCSEHGGILRVNTRSSVHFLSTVSAYFLTHLFFLGRLPSTELYALDSQALFQKNRKDWFLTSVTLSFVNLVTLINTLPFKVLDQCGLDLDRWFPLHRRAAALIKIKFGSRHYLAHCRATMATVQQRHQIACGVLSATPTKPDQGIKDIQLSSG